METTTRNRNLWIGIALIALVALVAFSGWGMGGIMAGRGFVGPYGYGVRPFAPWFIGFGIFGLLIRLLVWGGLIFLLVRAFRGRWGGWRGYGYRRFDDYEHEEPRQLDSMEILRRRYASGEITREQYEEMRQTIEHPAA